MEQIQSPNGGLLPRLLGPLDDWAVGPVGRVAVVRAQDYSVVWYHPDGRVVAGPPNPLEALPLDRATKETYLPRMRAAGISMWGSSSRSGGEVRAATDPVTEAARSPTWSGPTSTTSCGWSGTG